MSLVFKCKFMCMFYIGYPFDHTTLSGKEGPFIFRFSTHVGLLLDDRNGCVIEICSVFVLLCILMHYLSLRRDFPTFPLSIFATFKVQSIIWNLSCYSFFILVNSESWMFISTLNNRHDDTALLITYGPIVLALFCNGIILPRNRYIRKGLGTVLFLYLIVMV